MAIQLDWPTVRARLRALLFWQATSDEENQNPLDESRSLQALSSPTLDRLRRQLADLPEPVDRTQALRAETSQALHAWQTDTDAPNYLTFISEPIEPQAKLLQGLLAAPPLGGIARVTWLQREQITGDCSAIWQALQTTFGLSEATARGDRAIVAIPDLSWCFLRCIEGLDAIEALLATIATDRSRFWLLGCNRWAWLYLDRVCHLSAYLNSPVSLPTLTDEDLRRWLAPVAATLDLQPQTTDASEDAEESEEIWASAPERRCFAQIAELATGLPAVAAPLWLHSLRQKSPEDGDEASEESSTDRTQLTYATPHLPELPRLSADDRYLLYSLGLHDGLTLRALARSLAEPEPIVRAQLQRLRQQGLIIKRAGRFELAPLHYLRLKRDLGNNRFLVRGEP